MFFTRCKDDETISSQNHLAPVGLVVRVGVLFFLRRTAADFHF